MKPATRWMAAATAGLLAAALPAAAQRQMEQLDRGQVALHYEPDKVFVSWRLLGADPPDQAFNLYRRTNSDEPMRLNDSWRWTMIPRIRRPK